MTTHELFPLDELEPDSARRVEVSGRDIAVVRIGDDVYAIGDTCSHAEVSLSEGWVEPDDCAIECVAHGAMFDLETGEPLSLPATRAVPVYEASVVDGMVVLKLDAGSGGGAS
ncbi:MAG: non-heme iron oxygenase ferredoxin subunit [Acidimicrobiia bacterium]|nr:non-heme iron oxygenase ferredoxin subunit [Acidimicrobiia bacterium]